MRKKLGFILILLSSLAGIVLLKMAFMFFLLGLLPSMVAYFHDATEAKEFYRAVRACNLIGIMACVFPLLSHPHLDAALQVSMSDPDVWLVVLGAAAAGWVLVWVCRLVAYGVLVLTAKTHIFQLQRAQKELVKEWGEAIAEAKQY